MIHPDAKPVACHTPTDVPAYWRDDVDAGLDQDCKMGAIEAVPVGTSGVSRGGIRGVSKVANVKGHCIEFKYYADGIHSGLTPPG